MVVVLRVKVVPFYTKKEPKQKKRKEKKRKEKIRREDNRIEERMKAIL